MALSLTLDRDLAGHLAVALHALGTRNRQQGRVFPAALNALQAAAEHVVQNGEPMLLSITSNQEQSPAISRRSGTEDGVHAHEFLTRSDTSQLAGVSIATVDRWIASGQLSSTKRGRVRRIARADLDAFLSTPTRPYVASVRERRTA